MRNYDPSSEYDQGQVAKLKADPWQIDLLALNPAYTCWGPHEDYMWKEGSGWDSRQMFTSWEDFGPWGLDDLNEVVNFYFSVNRESKECRICGGNGYHPDAQDVVNGFYQHMNNRGESWCDKITQDELEALVEEGRIKSGASLEDVNYQNGAGRRGFMRHDAINRSILTEARLKRLGLPKLCPNCDGGGYTYTEDRAKVSLTLWVLHPRKGCSRGVEIADIRQEELPQVFAYLRGAAMRNADRFSKIPTGE